MSALEAKRAGEVRAYRKKRDQAETDAALSALREATRGEANLFPPVLAAFLLAAFRAHATLGEVCGVLREEWGEYRG